MSENRLKLKIFTCSDESKDEQKRFENEINEWLQAGPQTVIDRQMSSCCFLHESRGHVGHIITVSIWYQD